MSEASWIGRVGITFFHKEYNLLKIWWQGAIAVFIILLLLFGIHSLIQRRFIRQRRPFIAARIFHLLMLTLPIAGLYLSHDDFTNNFSHRLLGKRFHAGFYIFWLEWILICLFFAFGKGSTGTPTDQDSKEPTVP
jgi:hypothetical protein